MAFVQAANYNTQQRPCQGWQSAAHRGFSNTTCICPPGHPQPLQLRPWPWAAPSSGWGPLPHCGAAHPLTAETCWASGLKAKGATLQIARDAWQAGPAAPGCLCWLMLQEDNKVSE